MERTWHQGLAFLGEIPHIEELTKCTPSHSPDRNVIRLESRPSWQTQGWAGIHSRIVRSEAQSQKQKCISVVEGGNVWKVNMSMAQDNELEEWAEAYIHYHKPNMRVLYVTTDTGER